MDPLTVVNNADTSREAHVRAGLKKPTNIPQLHRPGQAVEHRDNIDHPHTRELPERRDSRDPQPSRMKVDGLPKGTPTLKPPTEKKVVDKTAGKRPVPPWLA
jgi:hypothetical protein